MLGRLRNACFLSLMIVCLACGGSGGGASNAPAIHGVVVARGFDQPVLYLADPADTTRAYVIEKPGRVKLLVNDVLQSAVVLDITGTVVTDAECGLLGMAFDPNYSSNHYVYLHYNAGTPTETRIVRYTMNVAGTSLSSPHPVFSFQQPTTPNHKGGSINFGSDGFLYIMTGDGGGGDDPNNYAQTPTSYLGKIIRIDPSGDDFPSDANQNYAIPSTNPWVGDSSVKPEIWAFGMRNPFRWSVDPVTGGLLIADVGQGAYEEVDYEPAGASHRNYGWNVREGLHASGDSGPLYFTPTTDPFLEYSHAFGESIIGGFIYRGTALDATLRGRYFFADYVESKLVSVPFSLTGAEATSQNIGSAYDHTNSIDNSLGGDSISGPVSVTPDKNGEIMVVNLNSGTLVRLVP